MNYFVDIYPLSVEFVLVVVLLGVSREDELVDPKRRVGMRVGVPSSLLINERLDPCRLTGLEPLGVTLDRVGILVFLAGVLLSQLIKLSLSESVRDFDERS